MLAHQAALPKLVTPPPAVPPSHSAVGTLNTASGTVLTVGSGMEFASLHDALSAAVAGDVIAVEAGTYTNDFGTVTVPVSILAIGGVVNEVANTPPPNGKGLLTVDASLTIQGVTFTGGGDGSLYGNIAGIRYEAGDLTVQYCDFHDMQDGLLATPGVVGAGNIVIDHSEFAHNGSGSGYTHNVYIGPVASATITNSYFHDAVVGHEIKSRAALTTITNNVIADNATGTASYDIDLPNAGVGRIVNNIIEKGPMASNVSVIHYGGETQFAYAKNALTVAGNTILSDLPAASGAVGVYNGSAVNGLAVSVSLIGNRLWGLDPARVILGGAGTQAGDTVLTTEPHYSTLSPWLHPPALVLSAGPQTLNLSGSGHVVTGGNALLTINDPGGSNTISGGSGGIRLTALAGQDVVATQAGAVDTLTVGGRYAYVTSAGRDFISVSGQYDGVTASGQSTIVSSQYDSFVLSGRETLVVSGGGGALLSAGAVVTANVTSVDLMVTVAGGAWLGLTDDRGGTPNTATISGGGATVCAGGGNIAVTTAGGGSVVQGGTGALNVTGGNGPDSITASTGLSKLALGSGADRVVFNGGIAQVQGGTGADSYSFIAQAAGHSGSVLISGYKQGADTLAFQGFAGNPIAGGVAAGGNTVLSLADGTTLTLLGVTLPGYGGGGSGGDTGGGGSGSGGSGSGGSGSGGSGSGGGGTTLTTTGQSVAGGTAHLTLIDLAGGNTIAGGIGGLSATIAALQDLVTTDPAASNQIVLSRQDTLLGGGADTVQVVGNYNTVQENGGATILLAAGGNSVQGGAGLLAVTDTTGGNVIHGGAGGLVLSGGGSYETVTTAAGAADTIAAGGYGVLNAAGDDAIAVSGYYPAVTASGMSSIVSTASAATFVLNGAESLAASGGAMVTVGSAAHVTLAIAASGQSSVIKAAGATLALSQLMPDGSAAAVGLTGGTASLNSSGGRYADIAITTLGDAGVAIHAQGGGTADLPSGPVYIASAGADTIWADAGQVVIHAIGGSGVAVIAGSGNTSLTGGTGNDRFTGGSGTAQLILGSGSDSITLGTGQLTVNGGTGADLFTAIAGAGTGRDVITGWSASDHLVFQGFAGDPIASQTIIGGSTLLALTDGAQITLVGITHFT